MRQSKFLNTARQDCHFQAGDVIEYGSVREGLQGLWFRSKVFALTVSPVSLCSKHFSHRPVKGARWVTSRPERPPEFPAKTEDSSVNGHKLLLRRTRPYAVGDQVDVFAMLCWWEGEVVGLQGEEAQIAFHHPPQHKKDRQLSVVSLEDLRPTLVWKDATWTLPPIRNGLPPLGSFEVSTEDASTPTPTSTPTPSTCSLDPKPLREPLGEADRLPSMTEDDVSMSFETLPGYVSRENHVTVQKPVLLACADRKVEGRDAQELLPTGLKAVRTRERAATREKGARGVKGETRKLSKGETGKRESARVLTPRRKAERGSGKEREVSSGRKSLQPLDPVCSVPRKKRSVSKVYDRISGPGQEAGDERGLEEFFKMIGRGEESKRLVGDTREVADADGADEDVFSWLQEEKSGAATGEDSLEGNLRREINSPSIGVEGIGSRNVTEELDEAIAAFLFDKSERGSNEDIISQADLNVEGIGTGPWEGEVWESPSEGWLDDSIESIWKDGFDDFGLSEPSGKRLQQSKEKLSGAAVRSGEASVRVAVETDPGSSKGVGDRTENRESFGSPPEGENLSGKAESRATGSQETTHQSTGATLLRHVCQLANLTPKQKRESLSRINQSQQQENSLVTSLDSLRAKKVAEELALLEAVERAAAPHLERDRATGRVAVGREGGRERKLMPPGWLPRVVSDVGGVTTGRGGDKADGADGGTESVQPSKPVEMTNCIRLRLLSRIVELVLAVVRDCEQSQQVHPASSKFPAKTSALTSPQSGLPPLEPPPVLSPKPCTDHHVTPRSPSLTSRTGGCVAHPRLDRALSSRLSKSPDQGPKATRGRKAGRGGEAPDQAGFTVEGFKGQLPGGVALGVPIKMLPGFSPIFSPSFPFPAVGQQQAWLGSLVPEDNKGVLTRFPGAPYTVASPPFQSLANGSGTLCAPAEAGWGIGARDGGRGQGTTGNVTGGATEALAGVINRGHKKKASGIPEALANKLTESLAAGVKRAAAADPASARAKRAEVLRGMKLERV